MPFAILLVIAALLIVAGAGSLLIGTDSVVPDRPLAAAIGGIVAMVGGFIIMALAFLLREISRLRISLPMAGGIIAAPPAQIETKADESAANAGLTDRSTKTVPTVGLDMGVAGAGALAAVAAAVGASAAAWQDDKPIEQPQAKPERDIDPIEQALSHVTGDDARKADTMPVTAETEMDAGSDVNSMAAGIENELAVAPDLAAMKEPIPDSDAQTPPDQKDAFDLEAEFDRMLDAPMGSLTKPHDVIAAPEQVKRDAVESDAVFENDLADDDLSLSDEDKQQLESLVRSAIEDVEEREALEKESSTSDQFAPVVPDIQALREKIASPMIDEEKAEVSVRPESDEIESDKVDEGAEEQVAAATPLENDPVEEAPPSIVPATSTPAFPPETVASKTIVRTFSSGLNQYTMYSDGSISADTPSGRFEFSSFNELREFIDTYKP